MTTYRISMKDEDDLLDQVATVKATSYEQAAQKWHPNPTRVTGYHGNTGWFQGYRQCGANQWTLQRSPVSRFLDPPSN